MQQGGTYLLAHEAIGSFVSEQGSDPEGPGRWSWLKLSGKSITTRVVVAYMPCTTRKQAVYATIAQQCRYWTLQGNKQCPRKLLRQDLIRNLKNGVTKEKNFYYSWIATRTCPTVPYLECSRILTLV